MKSPCWCWYQSPCTEFCMEMSPGGTSSLPKEQPVFKCLSFCASNSSQNRITFQTKSPFLLRSPVSRGSSELCWGVTVLGLCLGLSATLTCGINENEKLLTQNSLMSEENWFPFSHSLTWYSHDSYYSSLLSRAGQQGKGECSGSRGRWYREAASMKKQGECWKLCLNLVVQDLLISPVPPCWQLKCLFCSLVCPENSPELQELLRLEGLVSLLAPDLVSAYGWKFVQISGSCERLQDHCTIAS